MAKDVGGRGTTSKGGVESTAKEATYLGESLSGGLVLGDSDDVESNGLGQRSALSDGNDVSDLDSESGGAMSREVLVSLLVSRVLGDVVLQERGTIHWK